MAQPCCMVMYIIPASGTSLRSGRKSSGQWAFRADWSMSAHWWSICAIPPRTLTELLGCQSYAWKFSESAKTEAQLKYLSRCEGMDSQDESDTAEKTEQEKSAQISCSQARFMERCFPNHPCCAEQADLWPEPRKTGKPSKWRSLTESCRPHQIP